MSAYICSKEDFAYIASVMYTVTNGQVSKSSIVKIIDDFFLQNCRSVAYMYHERVADLCDENENEKISEDEIVEVELYFDEIEGALNCLAYQSCEDPDWEKSIVKKTIDGMIDACREFPVKGSDNSLWGAPKWFVEQYFS